MRKLSYTKLAKDVIEKADVILEVLDARLVQETRNRDLEELIERKGKRLIHVINKSDLAPRKYLQRAKLGLTNAIFISARHRDGMSRLRQLIYKVAAKSKTSESDIKVGVIGYPNVGKSSIINALAGRASASVSPVSGHTKALMKVRVTRRIMVIDSPGVIPVDEKDEAKLAIIASKNPDALKAPDLVAVQILWLLLQQHGEAWFTQTFGVPVPGQAREAIDLLDTLDAIALVRKRLSKGGAPDTLSMGRQVVMDWQRGKFQAVNDISDLPADSASDLDEDMDDRPSL